MSIEGKVKLRALQTWPYTEQPVGHEATHYLSIHPHPVHVAALGGIITLPTSTGETFDRTWAAHGDVAAAALRLEWTRWRVIGLWVTNVSGWKIGLGIDGSVNLDLPRGGSGPCTRRRGVGGGRRGMANGLLSNAYHAEQERDNPKK